jgi:hypothetical protein
MAVKRPWRRRYGWISTLRTVICIRITGLVSPLSRVSILCRRPSSMTPSVPWMNGTQDRLKLMPRMRAAMGRVGSSQSESSEDSSGPTPVSLSAVMGSGTPASPASSGQMASKTAKPAASSICTPSVAVKPSLTNEVRACMKLAR